MLCTDMDDLRDSNLQEKELHSPMAETVKLNSLSEAQEAFLRHLYCQTYANPIGNGRVYADRVLIDARPFDGGIHVSEVRALTGFRIGSGKAAMEFLTSLADVFGLTLSLNAKRIGKEGMTSPQLRKWCRQYGFNGTEQLLRHPQKVTKQGIYLSEHNDAP